MENRWLSDYIIYCERGEHAYVRRACRPLESYLKRLNGLSVTLESVAAEEKYLTVVPGGATCECPACRLRAPGSAGMFWAYSDESQAGHWFRQAC